MIQRSRLYQISFKVFINNKVMIFLRFSFLSVLTFLLLASCVDNKTEAESSIQLGIDKINNFKEGKHYETLDDSVPTRDSSKVEVIEFFWLSCGHCYNLEGHVSSWEKTLPNDVDFYRSHITWHAQAETQARIMYTARALGLEDEAIAGAFHAIHRERQLMTGQSELESFFRGLGVPTEKYKSISSSFGVNHAVSQANKRMRNYKLQSVPSFIVNGKYKVTAIQGQSAKELLEVVEHLIKKERPYLIKAD